jgi:hypothetical protein
VRHSSIGAASSTGVRLCGYMWRSDVVEVLGGSRESHDVLPLIVNQAYACATTNSTTGDLGTRLVSTMWPCFLCSTEARHTCQS